jgi:hypothetical protein
LGGAEAARREQQLKTRREQLEQRERQRQRDEEREQEAEKFQAKERDIIVDVLMQLIDFQAVPLHAFFPFHPATPPAATERGPLRYILSEVVKQADGWDDVRIGAGVPPEHVEALSVWLNSTIAAIVREKLAERDAALRKVHVKQELPALGWATRKTWGGGGGADPTAGFAALTDAAAAGTHKLPDAAAAPGGEKLRRSPSPDAGSSSDSDASLPDHRRRAAAAASGPNSSGEEDGDSDSQSADDKDERQRRRRRIANRRRRQEKRLHLVREIAALPVPIRREKFLEIEIGRMLARQKRLRSKLARFSGPAAT